MRRDLFPCPCLCALAALGIHAAACAEIDALGHVDELRALDMNTGACAELVLSRQLPLFNPESRWRVRPKDCPR